MSTLPSRDRDLPGSVHCQPRAADATADAGLGGEWTLTTVAAAAEARLVPQCGRGQHPVCAPSPIAMLCVNGQTAHADSHCQTRTQTQLQALSRVAWCALRTAATDALSVCVVLQGVNLVLAADGTHKWYKGRFKSYPPARKALVPLVW